MKLTNSRPPGSFTPKDDTMHRPPQLAPFGDVVVGEGARAAFGEEVRLVEVYHRDGEDAGACFGWWLVGFDWRGERGMGVSYETKGRFLLS